MAVRDAQSQHEIRNASIQPKGHGYMVPLPGARDAGFEDGDAEPVRHGPGLFIITTDSRRAMCRGEDLETSWRDIIE